ncbi:thermonuclease family protein [Ferrovum myxofaciens]|uniref:TNase-like domain-containing protein n=1 Tax=Ferrovum myxofaciens TaxID=416213 RepID=A0A9E6SX60_9PROT|nr:thermonuclease family protein [Ferrovum myxofaciens]MBU6995298.1 hypothetical protein [Ferrovum myxofaciens]QKE39076.1 MAG: hypothetical protein HO273_10395 [Ferrovum myxofaciens]QWY74312.1 MAG: hypothetical protein JVY19_10940 [Ferrovum myxofaciens]QWY77063.1 MAG: hypothetical protein JZL65_11385 [Ferrovum myxofaciens]
MKSRPTWLEGCWVVLDHAPDGDSVRFVPDHPIPVAQCMPRLRWSKDGALSVRLLGVDAPEIHYRRRGQPLWRQPSPWGEQAAQALLNFLGFSSLQRNLAGRVVGADPQACRGTLGVLRVDRYGRALGLALRGEDRGARDASLAWEDTWEASANQELLRQGHVYPLVHKDFPTDWRISLSTSVQMARMQSRGIWPADRTHCGFPLSDAQTLRDTLESACLIWPFLFRRLVDVETSFLRGSSSAEWLSRLNRCAGSVSLSSVNGSVPFLDLISFADGKLQLLVPPEEIVIHS